MDGETGDAQIKEDTQLAAAAEEAPAVQADEAAAGHPPSIAGQEPDASAADQPQADSDQPNGAATAEADAAEPGGAQAEPRADTSAAPQPEAEQGEAGSNHKEPSETQPSQEQGAEGATTEQPGQPGVEAAAASQPEDTSEPADVAMTDAAEAAPAAQPQGDEPAAKDSGKESESPVQAAESHQPITGSAKGKRKAAPKNRKGNAARRHPAKSAMHTCYSLHFLSASVLQTEHGAAACQTYTPFYGYQQWQLRRASKSKGCLNVQELQQRALQREGDPPDLRYPPSKPSIMQEVDARFWPFLCSPRFGVPVPPGAFLAVGPNAAHPELEPT